MTTRARTNRCERIQRGRSANRYDTRSRVRAPVGPPPTCCQKRPPTPPAALRGPPAAVLQQSMDVRDGRHGRAARPASERAPEPSRPQRGHRHGGGAVPGREPRQHRPRVVRRQVPGAADRLQLQQPQPGAGQRRARRVDLLRRRVPPPARLRSALLPARPVVRRRRHPLDGAPLPHVRPDAADRGGLVQEGLVRGHRDRAEQLLLPVRGGIGHAHRRVPDRQRDRHRGAAVPAAQLRQPVRGAPGGGPRTSSPTTACSSSPSASWRSPRPCGSTAAPAARWRASSSSTERSRPTARRVRRRPDRSRAGGRGRR